MSLSLTQEQLAHRAGLTTATIIRAEASKVSPRIDTLIKLAGALGMPVGELLVPPEARRQG